LIAMCECSSASQQVTYKVKISCSTADEPFTREVGSQSMCVQCLGAQPLFWRQIRQMAEE
jgi:hypothetical protein